MGDERLGDALRPRLRCALGCAPNVATEFYRTVKTELLKELFKIFQVWMSETNSTAETMLKVLPRLGLCTQKATYGMQARKRKVCTLAHSRTSSRLISWGDFIARMHLYFD